jgi:hypothetical protein
VPHTIRVPADFDMQSALFESFPDVDPQLVRVAGGRDTHSILTNKCLPAMLSCALTLRWAMPCS